MSCAATFESGAKQAGDLKTALLCTLYTLFVVQHLAEKFIFCSYGVATRGGFICYGVMRNKTEK